MFGKKKTQHLKSSYLRYFMEKKSWNLKCKFKYDFSIVLYKKKGFFDFMQKKVFWDLNSELKLVTDWLRANKLSLNESKAKLLLFRPINKMNLTLSNIKLNGHLLALAKSVTYLGIEIDETLSWNNQIQVLAKKLSRTNRSLSKLRYYIPTETLTSTYYSLFQSYILYGSTFWCYTFKKILRRFLFSKKDVWGL